MPPNVSDRARRAMKELQREIETNPEFSGGPLILRLERVELIMALTEPPFVLHERLKSISGMMRRDQQRAHVFMEGIFRDIITVIGTNTFESRDKEGNSLLHLVVLSGNKKVLEMLIDAGAEIDEQNRKRETSLEMSILSSRADLFQLLVDLGCDPYRYTLPMEYFYSLLEESSCGTRMQEIAVKATKTIGTVFDNAVSNFCNRDEVASMVDLSPVITLPFCPGPEYGNAHKSVEITVSLDSIHEEICSIRNAIVVLPMKYIKEENKYIVLQNPGPIYKTPTIKPIGEGGEIYRLPDMSFLNNHLKVEPGRFFYCRHLYRKNVLTIRITANQLQRCFLGVKLFQFHVKTNQPKYCDEHRARHPGMGHQEFGQCGGGSATHERVVV